MGGSTHSQQLAWSTWASVLRYVELIGSEGASGRWPRDSDQCHSALSALPAPTLGHEPLFLGEQDTPHFFPEKEIQIRSVTNPPLNLKPATLRAKRINQRICSSRGRWFEDVITIHPPPPPPAILILDFSCLQLKVLGCLPSGIPRRLLYLQVRVN